MDTAGWSTAYSDWQAMCEAITHQADFPLSPGERGLVFYLVASPPTAPLRVSQVQRLVELKTRWERLHPPPATHEEVFDGPLL
jgi:hypothetical protein